MLSAILLTAIASAEDEGNLDVGYRIALRPELYANPDHNPATENDSLFQTYQSVRLIVDSTWTNVKMRAAFQDVRLWGTEQTQAVSRDALAGLFEGYFELGNDELFLRAGRQMVSMHSEFLFAKANWNPYGRAFDGVTLHAQKGKKLSANARLLVWNTGSTFQSSCEDDPETIDLDECEGFEPESLNSYGDFVTIIDGEVKVNDAFVAQPFIIILDQNRTASEIERDRMVYSPGLRLIGSPTKEFSYELQGIFQTGRASTDVTHEAWSVAAQTDYKTEKWGTFARYENNSGDGDATDDVDNNFEAFLGARHKFRGWADRIGGVNSQIITLGTNYRPIDLVNVILNYHNLRLSNPNGLWYDFRLDVIGVPNTNNTDTNLGNEIDALINLKAAKGVSFKFGHSVFIPDGAGADIVAETMTTNDTQQPYHFSYLWIVAER